MSVFRKLIYLFVFLFTAGIINAQEPDTLQLGSNDFFIPDSITITGNETTEPFVILRELNFKPGDTLSLQKITFNRERVYSLGIFNFVNFYTIRQNNHNILVIDVKESWYIYPIPFVVTTEHSLDKLSYGINLLYKNFRGRNETLYTRFAFGYDPYFMLLYSNPALNESKDLRLIWGFISQSLSNKSKIIEQELKKSFDSKYITSYLSLGKRFGQNTQVFVTGSFTYLENPFRYKDLNASDDRTDRFPSLGFTFVFDNRDLAQQPGSGSLLNVEFTNNGLGFNNINFNLFSFMIKDYQDLGYNLVLRNKFVNRSTFGRLVPRAFLSYLGSQDYVRGYKDEVMENRNYFVYSAELNYYLLKEWDVSIKLPLIPQKLTSARIAFAIKTFFDTGASFDKIHNLAVNNLISSYGIGCTVYFLPYNLIRIDYAINKYKKGELVIGAGFSF